jgi:hypothetical protein
MGVERGQPKVLLTNRSALRPTMVLSDRELADAQLTLLVKFSDQD